MNHPLFFLKPPADKPPSARKKSITHIQKALSARKEQLLCLLAAVILAAAVTLSRQADPNLVKNELVRSGYGESDLTYPLSVTGLFADGREIPVNVSVAARKYTEKEAQEAFRSLAEALPARIAGENENLRNVSADLILPRSVEETGIRITWYPDDPDLISYDGTVQNEDLTENRTAALKAVMSDGTYSQSYVYDVTVTPRALTEEEGILFAFEKALTQADAAQLTSSVLTLPSEFEGRALTYRAKQGHEALWILLLGLFAALLLGFRGHSEERELQKKRREELLTDYSELVSKFIVYLGAGLTVRNAWLKIADTYNSARTRNLCERRIVYEEMRCSADELQKGVPEGKVYHDFGRRCRLQPYMKFCTLLDQNRKNGGRNLRALLEAEMESAFEERKNAAKRKGEEAGTKLLLPLFLMLIIVMVIVILPAMLSMA